jgi:NADH:ubiquinone oxidoreductase subunit F (NADH-binding)
MPPSPATLTADPVTTALAPGHDRPGAGATLLGAHHAGYGADLAGHLAYHGQLPLPRAGDTGWPERLAECVEASGLTGRGGAGFPSSTKLRSVGVAGGTLVVNAMEGEPASTKDKALLSCAPHLVLDGAQLTASAMSAARIVVCVADDDHHSARMISYAMAERSGTAASPVATTVARPPAAYVAGEESALVSWLDGGPGVPTFRPVKGMPLSARRRRALVHNAETLAHVALIARHGPGTFRSTGSADAPGTTLVTITGGVARPGVYEIPLGARLEHVIARARPTDAVQAVLTGGFGGSWLPAAALGTPYAPKPMAAAGGVLGAGVLVVLPRNACGITETARVAHYMAGQSAGQCGPCVFGLPALARDLSDVADGTADGTTLRRLDERLTAVSGRGACRHPDGVARMVHSALTVFAGDVATHVRGTPCAHRARPSMLPPQTACRRGPA